MTVLHNPSVTGSSSLKETLPSNKHLPALDGVRGLAVLFVVACHTGGGARSANPIIRILGLVAKTGWSGVTLFFILSGFLITGILWDSRGSVHWLKNFYMRRVLRIFPLYYLALLLVVVTAFFAHQGMFCLSRIWMYVLYLQNVPGIVNVGALGSPLWLSHFWSLAVEEQFYLFWPFLISRVKTLEQAKNLCLVVFVTSAIFRVATVLVASDPAVYNGLIMARAGELAFGAYLAMSYRSVQWKWLRRIAPFATPVMLAGFLAVWLPTRDSQESSSLMLTLGFALITLFWGGFVVLALGDGLVNRAMRVGWLRWTGGISYGIYVYHVLLTPVFPWITVRLMPHAGKVAGLILNAIVTIVISYLVAWASFRYFESPFLKLRRKFHSEPKPVESSDSSVAV